MDCSLHVGFSSKNSEVGCHFLLQVIFLTQGIKPGSLPLLADALPYEPPGKFILNTCMYLVVSAWLCKMVGFLSVFAIPEQIACGAHHVLV